MPVPELMLLAAGRQLTFADQPNERAHIFRRVGGETAPWQRDPMMGVISAVP